MPEFRFNILTREWVIIATERAKRPIEFALSESPMRLPAHDPKCPFCPGNEKETAQEVGRVCHDNGEWQTRTIKNRYPALYEDATPTVSDDMFHPKIGGFGIHEVMIDSRQHNAGITDLPMADVEKIIYTYRDRYRAHEHDPRVKHIILFKNSGHHAGSSLMHPHSQLIATPVISSHTEERVGATRAYRKETGRCLVCDMIQKEIALNERIIFENDHFVSFLPYAALSSFHTWIMPKKHHAHFGRLEDDHIPAMAEALYYVLKAQEKLLNRPDYNLIVRSAPIQCPDEDYHWYLSIIPCVAKTAGFEIGSHIYINSSLPEHNALELRNVVDILRGF